VSTLRGGEGREKERKKIGDERKKLRRT